MERERLLPVADVEAILTLVRDLHAAAEPRSAATLHPLLETVSALMNADAAALIELHADAPPGEPPRSAAVGTPELQQILLSEALASDVGSVRPRGSEAEESPDSVDDGPMIEHERIPSTRSCILSRLTMRDSPLRHRLSAMSPLRRPRSWLLLKLGRQVGQKGFSARDVALLRLLTIEIAYRPLLPAPTPESAPSLPPHLMRVLERLMAGDSAKEAARRLGLSVHTVTQYSKELYRRFGVNTRGQLLARFIPQTQGEVELFTNEPTSFTRLRPLVISDGGRRAAAP